MDNCSSPRWATQNSEETDRLPGENVSELGNVSTRDTNTRVNCHVATNAGDTAVAH